MSEITSIVRRLRQRGMSQAAIAKQAGIAQPTVAKWEAGRVPKAADAALRLRALEQAPAVTEGASV